MARRSVQVSIERRRSGDDLNDNYPSVLPGHELAGLDGLPRPPTAEAVSHYSRFTQIGSFPQHPSEPAPIETAEPPPMEASQDRPRKAAPSGMGRLAFASVGSFLFHAAVVAILLVAIVATPEEAQEEAGDTVSVVMIGNSDADQMAAGEESPEQPPEEVTAEAVQPETVQPTEIIPQDVQPVEAEAVQPTEPEVQPTEMAEAIPPTDQPQILATQAPAETTVIQPEQAVQPVEPTPEVVTPVEKPKPVAKPKDVVKKPVPKVAKVKSGSKGESEQDSRRGSVEGTETAQSDTTSQVDARRTGSGSAAVANYPGKIQSRIRRAVRLSSKYEKGITVRVRLTIGANGDLASLSVARSSGVPELDEAVTSGVRRAAPFPPLPPEWGKPSWTFTQEVQVTGR